MDLREWGKKGENVSSNAHRHIVCMYIDSTTVPLHTWECYDVMLGINFISLPHVDMISIQVFPGITVVCNTRWCQRAVCSFISPPNVYMSNTGLVPGSTGGYTARWCQRAV